MRVCLESNIKEQSIIGKAPSEPVICEAARLVMRSCKCNLPNILTSEFNRPDVLRGPRGEVVMKLLITSASDEFVTKGQPQVWKVTDFLEKLFYSPCTQNGSSIVRDALPSTVHPRRKKITKETKFSEAFEGYVMYISHIIKAKSVDVLDRNCVWALASRHAGVECANGQGGVGIFLPIMRRDKTLGRYTVSVIVIQVKNNARYKDIPDVHLFDAMSPYTTHLFSSKDQDFWHGGPPIIRIVAAFSSPTPALTSVQDISSERKQTLRTSTKEATRSSRAYTAYDFWCAGLSPEVWGPIKADNVVFWRQLLDASGSKGINYTFKDKDREALRRSQGIAEAGIKEMGHWSWIERDDTYIDSEDEDGTRSVEDAMDVDDST
jgi:hypothetical protein